MKKKLLKVSVLALAIILLLQVATFAAVEKLTLKTTADKDTYTVGDKVTVTVDWTEGMQAAVFKLKYDSSKLTFNSASISASYYNADTAGVVSVNWASLEEIDYTKITFTFTAKAAGASTISVSEPKFANGNLEEPTSYDVTTSGSKSITVNEKVEPKPEPQPEPEPEPEKITLTSIEITKQPTKYEYKVGQKFDKTGIEVTAIYSDGSKKVVTNYTYSPDNELKESDEKVVVTYTENGVTKTAEQKITVIKEIENKVENKVENNKNTTNKKDNTTASGKMPQTGAENIVFVVVLVAILGTIGFIKYRKLSDI